MSAKIRLIFIISISTILVVSACRPVAPIDDSNKDGSPTPNLSTPTNTPKPAPTITSTPSLESVLDAQNIEYSQFVGEGMEQAESYERNIWSSHPVILLDRSGELHEYQAALPANWQAQSLEDIELVVYALDELEIELDSQEYDQGPDITRYRYDLPVEIYMAKTGKLLKADTIKGPEPQPFPETAPLQQTRIDGESVNASHITGWLISILYSKVMDENKVANCLVFSTKMQVLAAGFDDGAIRIYQMPDGEIISELKSGGPVMDITISPKGDLLASTSWDQNVITIWDLNTGKIIDELQGHVDTVFSIDFSPNGQKLVSSSLDESILVWNIVTGEPFPMDGYSGRPSYNLTFSPDGNLIASNSSDGYVRLWNPENGSRIKMLISHSMDGYGLAFSPNASLLVSSYYHGKINIWEMSEDSEPHIISAHTDGVNSLIFSYDGKILASASDDGTIGLWQTDDFRLLSRLYGHTESVNSLEITNEGYLLISASQDATIRIWNLDYIAP